MQEQTINPAVEGVIVKEDAGEHGLPPKFLEQILAADAVVLIGSSETSVLVMQCVVAGGLFQPEQIESHAYVDAIYKEHANLVHRMRGEPTDSQRYQAMREFAVLASTDPKRFEVVNVMLQEFEDSHQLADENKRTGEDFDKIANFVVQALLETAPGPIVAAPVPN